MVVVVGWFLSKKGKRGGDLEIGREGGGGLIEMREREREWIRERERVEKRERGK